MVSGSSKSFVKSVTVLFTGTVIAQVVTYLLSPVISRQFDPEQSAYLGLFLRITTLGAALATARLELAFPLQKNDHHAFGIYRFSMRFSIGLSLAALVLLGIYSWIDFTTLHDLFFLLSLPLGIFLMAFYNQGNSWALRKEDYKIMANSSLALSVSTNLLKVFFGLFSGSFLWLIGATILGYFTSCITYFRTFRKNRRNAVLTFRSKRTKALIASNSDLYKYNLPHVFIDLARDLLLASVIWNLYGKMEYGSYDHAFRMLKLPIVFIGGAIGQVFFRKSTQLIHENKPVFPLALKVVLILGGLSIIPFALVAFFGQDLFAIVFGDRWAEAGKMAAIMVPWLLLNFLSSSISYIPVLMNRQRTFFWLNLAGTLGLIAVVSIPYWGNPEMGFYTLLQWLSISQTCFLAIILGWMLYIVKKERVKQ